MTTSRATICIFKGLALVVLVPAAATVIMGKRARKYVGQLTDESLGKARKWEEKIEVATKEGVNWLHDEWEVRSNPPKPVSGGSFFGGKEDEPEEQPDPEVARVEVISKDKQLAHRIAFWFMCLGVPLYAWMVEGTFIAALATGSLILFGYCLNKLVYALAERFFADEGKPHTIALYTLLSIATSIISAFVFKTKDQMDFARTGVESTIAGTGSNTWLGKWLDEKPAMEPAAA